MKNKSFRFDSINIGGMTYADQFLQISAKLPSKYIYGIGEHQDRLLLSTKWSKLTLFNHDQAPTEHVINFEKYLLFQLLI